MTVAAVPIPVEVDVLSFSKLFEESIFPMAVDTYQRSFVWNDDKVQQLVEDLAAYQRDADSKQPYYMSTILLHRDSDKQKHFITDGQQRLTALCVLHQQLKDSLPGKCALTYSPKSARRSRAAAGILREALSRPSDSIFGQIVFTVICVERVDLAFTFFDTRNNRGVSLHATDLFKAYHLRAMGGETEIRKKGLQTLCAQRWERIQQGMPVMSHDREFDQPGPPSARPLWQFDTRLQKLELRVRKHALQRKAAEISE